MKNKKNVILLTHIINPNHFYFKYLNECVSDEFSKFDFELQLYGNGLHAENKYANGYLPANNELVIFFHVIFNKWIRGRVIQIGQECIFWCIDNGTFESSSLEFVLPITERFRENLSLVHSGGLSLLPAEKKLNVETLDIEMQLSTKWDDEMMSTFKRIIQTSKSIIFTEELDLSYHKLGSLTIQSKNDKLFDINSTFMEMSKAAPFVKELSSYMNKDRLEEELYRSYNHASTKSAELNLTKAVSHLSMKDGAMNSSIDNSAPSEYYEDFDDSASMVLSSNTLQTLSNGIKSSSTSKASSTSNSSATPNTDLNAKRIKESSGNIAETSVSSIGNLSIESKARALSEIGNSENHSFNGFDDTASITLSSATTLATDKKSSQSSSSFDENEEIERLPALISEKDYECYLYTCRINRGMKLRRPLEETIDQINSFPSSYQNHHDKDKEASNALPSASSLSSRLNRRKMLAAVLKKGVLEDENDESTNTKFVNYEKNQKHGVPAGYPKNLLETFGGLTRKN